MFFIHRLAGELIKSESCCREICMLDDETGADKKDSVMPERQEGLETPGRSLRGWWKERHGFYIPAFTDKVTEL